MLFHPEGDQRWRKVMANGRQPVDAGVAGSTKGNQPFEGVLTRAAVMHMDPPRIEMRGSAALATTPIPEKNLLAMTAKTELRIPETHLADPAEIGAGQLGGATRAEEPGLGDHGQII
jgi:hypothetical protein